LAAGSAPVLPDDLPWLAQHVRSGVGVGVVGMPAQEIASALLVEYPRGQAGLMCKPSSH